MKRVLSLVLLLVVVSALVLGSCGESTPTTTTTTKPTTSTAATPTISTTATPTTPAETSPKYGGTLKMISAPLTTNAGGWPADYIAGGEVLTGQLVFDSFLHGDDKGNVYPWLAESYKLADDLLSITFTFRKDVKFHDGTDFNAQAAKWNLNNMIEAGRSPNWTSVEVLDDYSIRVNFDKWENTLLMAFVDSSPSYMVSPTAYEKNGKDWMVANPVGTGPFKFVSFQKDVSFICVKNPDYWQKDEQGRQLPYLDGVNIMYVADEMTQKALIQAGEGDVLEIEPGKDSAAMEAAGLLLDTRIITTWLLFPDTANPDSPYANKKVREAVEYAINREAIADAFSYGFWEAPNQIPPPSNPVWNPNFTLARQYDPEKAKQLLAEAGYPGGFTTTLVYGAAGTMAQNICLALQSDLSKVGIKCELEFPDFGKYIATGSTYHNALAFLPIVEFGNFNSSVANVMGQYTMFPNKNWERTPEFLELSEKSLTSPVVDVELGRAITDYVSEEAQVIPVYAAGRHYVSWPYVMDAGYWTRSFESYWNCEKAWLNK